MGVAAEIAPRISAAAVDFIVLGLAGFALTAVLGVPSLGSSLVVVGVMLVVGAGYFVGFWSLAGGATPGMRLFRLVVRDATVWSSA